MIDSINNIYKRMKDIKNYTKGFKDYKPEIVRNFDDLYNSAVQKNKKSNVVNDKSSAVHPYLKVETKENDKNLNNNNKTQIDDAISKASLKYKVSEDLIRAVISIESNYDQYAVSKSGAMGLMQIIPKTSLDLGLEKPFDIYDNIDAGVKYLKSLLNKYNGDLEKSLAAYNAGPENVDKYNGIPDFTETKEYVKKIKAILLNK
ncbi:MAG: lytic transglycosylase domain-containing protein [Spirochaetes bacterium]|nr:lytic transglycosylase domain-containing protein [Spirochaetota bacterium]